MKTTKITSNTQLKPNSMEALAVLFEPLVSEITKHVVSELKGDGSQAEQPSSGECYYTIPEVCKMFRVTKPTLYRHINCGTIKTFKFGRRTLIDAQQIDALISSGRNIRYEHKRI